MVDGLAPVEMEADGVAVPVAADEGDPVAGGDAVGEKGVVGDAEGTDTPLRATWSQHTCAFALCTYAPDSAT